MENVRPLKRLCQVQIQKLLVLVISLVAVLVVVAQLITFPYKNDAFTKGILVHEVAIYDNASISHKEDLNETRVEEGCQGHDCDHKSLLSQIAMKQNDSGQTVQTVAVALEPTRLSYMISVLESTTVAHFSVGILGLDSLLL